MLYSFDLLADTEPPVTVAAGATTRIDRKLDWDLAFQETITVVSASRNEERITEAPAAITSLPLEEIEVKAATGQLPKLFEFTPGAEVTQSGVYDYNLNTRGFNSSLNRRVATLIDGRDPSVPFLGSQEWAAISFPLDDLAEAELVRGPSAALYGANASSGVINLVTKRPKDSQGGLVRLTGGELSTLNADLRWAGRHHRFDLLQGPGRLSATAATSPSRASARPSIRCPAPPPARPTAFRRRWRT